MKKFLFVIFAALLCVALMGCGNQSADEPSEVAGGWHEAEDGTITEAHTAMFEKALEGYTGASYTPVRLVATQVVSGVNYKFLCEQTIIAAEIVKTEKYVTIYCDLEGNCSIINVEEVGE